MLPTIQFRMTAEDKITVDFLKQKQIELWLEYCDISEKIDALEQPPFLVHPTMHAIFLDLLTNIVAENVDWDINKIRDIEKPNREDLSVAYRTIIIKLARNYRLPLKTIGRWFNKDHSTIINLEKSHKMRMVSNLEYAKLYHKLRTIDYATIINEKLGDFFGGLNE